MTRRTLLIGGVTATLIVTGVVSLRWVPFFRVRQVELVGVRYLAPERVLAALDMKASQNVFDRVRPLRQRLERLPGVLQAQIDRRLPGTLRVRVVERAPVAFVSGPEGMVALDCNARPLPYDPTRGGLDLPVARRADRAVLGTLCAVRAADTLLYRSVDLAYGGDDAVTLKLAAQRVVVRSYPSPAEIRAVVSVRRHLAGTGERVSVLDARFKGWVVAQRSGT